MDRTTLWKEPAEYWICTAVACQVTGQLKQRQTKALCELFVSTESQDNDSESYASFRFLLKKENTEKRRQSGPPTI